MTQMHAASTRPVLTLRVRLILSECLSGLPASRGYYANITYVSESTYMQVEEGT